MIPSQRKIRAFLVVMTLIPVFLLGAGVGAAAALLIAPEPQYKIAAIDLVTGAVLLGSLNYTLWVLRARSVSPDWWFGVTPRVWTAALNLSFFAGFIALFAALASIPTH